MSAEAPVDALASERLTLLDLADHLLERGVVVSGQATISVADVDLIYLGLNAVIGAVQTIERGQRGRSPSEPEGPAAPPGRRPNASLARNVPGGRGMPDRPGAGPGAMASTEAGPAEVEAVLPSRIDVAPDEVERGLAKLVLTLVEFLRQLLERQAVRRMEGGSLSDEEVERVGLALMRLERKVKEMAGMFGLRAEELNVDLGPLGSLR